MRATILVLFMALIVVASFGASRTPVRSKNGMVVSAHRLASEVGVHILQQGGNAIDAAVAVGFALAVVYPEAGNIGGSGFLLARMSDGRASVVDFRSTAPSAVSSKYFLDSTKRLNGVNVLGHKAVCVPGTVAGMVKAWELYGSMKFSDLLDPAIELADHGFLIDRRMEHSLKSNCKDFSGFLSTVRFLPGIDYKEGDTLRFHELAETLRRIRKYGKDGFYRGRTADLIVAEMRRGGGFITKQDLESYEAIVREPVKGTYRGYDVLGPPLPSSGGICLLEFLNILEHFHLQSMGYHSSQSVHIMAETMKHIFADRTEYLGDPGFSHLPVYQLTSKEYARRVVQEIDSVHATPSASIGHGDIDIHEGNQTTHYVVADAQRNVVAVTFTLNDLYGCKVVVDSAGFFLNDDIDDFSMTSGTPNSYGLFGTSANELKPGKRPLSSMSPTIIVKDGKPLYALGARGGPKIITSVGQTIVNLIDYSMNIQEAVDAPRFYHQWFPDTLIYDKFCFPSDVVKNLHQMGYVVQESDDYLGRLEALSIDSATGWIYGAPDPREEGEAIGY